MSYLILLGLFTLLGACLGWIAFYRQRRIEGELGYLRQEIQALKKQSSTPPDTASSSSIPQALPASEQKTPDIAHATAPSASRPMPESAAARSSRAQRSPAAIARQTKGEHGDEWIEHLKNNWMIWLGGSCIGLAGIFLARYSIEQGFLGPGARITGGIVLGLALHIGAEWLRRNREPHKALAALAAGGSITLFAAFLAALHLYQLMNVWLVFASLTLVALVTMALALLHGPVLAAMGILGAYLVPVLIGGEAGNALSACLYALIISASALYLMRFVYRPWLWLGMVAGSIFWWFLTYGEPGMQIMSSLYLVLMAYLMISIPAGDYFLLKQRESMHTGEPLDRYYRPAQAKENLLPHSIVLLIGCQFFSIVIEGFDGLALVKYSPLCVLILLAGSRREYLLLHSWVLLLSLGAGWILSQLTGSSITPLGPDQVIAFYWYSLCTVLIFSVMSIFNFRFIAPRATWVSLATVTPVLMLALTFVLTTDQSRSLQWGLMACVLAASYMALTRINWRENGGDTTLAWLFIAAHLAYSLAVAMFLREATMTLALAAQVVSLAWVLKRYNLKEVGWIMKGVVAVVVFRLSLNPWLQQYPTDIHWSLWTYGGATLCCLAGRILLKGRDELQQWTWVAVIHLFALTLWAETRYWLYDGDVYAGEYSFLEAALNMSIFGVLGLVYYLRVQTSTVLAPLYRAYSNILIGFSLCNYALILLTTLFSVSWAWSDVGATPLFNIMLIAYGFPVVLGVLYSRFYESVLRKKALLFTATSAFIFISLEVRHLWQGSISLTPSPEAGELYSYSALWLVIAVACILGGVWRYGKEVYKAGMLLLAVVIAKLFLVDMSDLQGLLRVASFMGMGLCLLGIAYLHQRVNSHKVPENQSEAP